MNAMLKYSCLPRRFDPLLLQRDLRQVPGDVWMTHYQKRDFEGGWDVLALRARGGDEHAIYSVPGASTSASSTGTGGDLPPYENTPLLALCPYIKDMLDALQCEKTSVRLMRLRGNSEIKRHSDTALALEEGEARLHVPIITNPGVEFYLEDERLQLKEGDCWYLNLTLEHHVINRSHEDRVHLVIDCVTNDWLLDLFRSPGAKIKEYTPAPRQYSDAEARLIAAQLRRMGSEVADRLAAELEDKHGSS